MSRTYVYKLNTAQAVVTEFVELPGRIISNDEIDYQRPPVIPDDLQKLFSMLAKTEQPVKLIVCGGNSTHASPENRNGWSMCQSAPVIRRRLGDAQRTAFLAPKHTP